MFVSIRAFAAAAGLAAGFVAFGPEKTESGFAIHDQESAPEPVRDVFAFYKQNFGFVPNLAAVMADSPSLLLAYKATQDQLMQHSTLTPAERNVVQLAVSVENECRYCTSGHTMLGKGFWKTPEDAVQAIRAEKSIPDPKLRALHTFAMQVYAEHGHVGSASLTKFLDAGYTRAQALDVVACIAAKVMSNYTNGLAHTPLDEPIKPFSEGLQFGK